MRQMVVSELLFGVYVKVTAEKRSCMTCRVKNKMMIDDISVAGLIEHD